MKELSRIGEYVLAQGQWRIWSDGFVEPTDWEADSGAGMDFKIKEGFGVLQPRLDWQFFSNERNARQFYQEAIDTADDITGGKILKRSGDVGKVKSYEEFEPENNGKTKPYEIFNSKSFNEWLKQEEDLIEFANEVNEIARGARSERESKAPTDDNPKGQRGARFGEKIFLYYIELMMGIPTGEFKDKLIAANRAGLIELSRADLVQVMHPDDVRQSETTTGIAQFHFVRPKSVSKDF